MKTEDLKIKLDFISGLEDVVLSEVKQLHDLKVVHENDVEENCIYVNFVRDFSLITSLRSVLHAYLIKQNNKYTPHYISNHKSILGDLIIRIIQGKEKQFKSFKITCAGSDSPEVRAIAEYIEKTFELHEKEEADLKVYIIKPVNTWEVGVQITPRPLSFREYKVVNMSGAMNPTIAYAVNSFCNLKNADSYLNVFSGSATLLIEAAQSHPNLETVVGFDSNKKHLSLSIQNIKKAGLIQKVIVKERDIFDHPDLGKFDAITSDLPFGMVISKGEDLAKLYQSFVSYCEKFLNVDGTLVMYTSEHGVLEDVISRSKFKVIKKIRLEFITNTNTHLHPKIFVCKLREN